LPDLSLQIVLGSVYAWRVFRVPLTRQFHWTISEVTLTFTISIFMLGIAAFFGGLWLNRSGPRIVALSGVFLYGLGTLLASLSANRLWWLYLSYGFIGGFGAGALVTAPIATHLIQSVGVLPTFAYPWNRLHFFRLNNGLFHAESAGGMGSGRMDSFSQTNCTTFSKGLYPRWGFEESILDQRMSAQFTA
jgi:MFS family permease